MYFKEGKFRQYTKDILSQCRRKVIPFVRVNPIDEPTPESDDIFNTFIYLSRISCLRIIYRFDDDKVSMIMVDQADKETVAFTVDAQEWIDKYAIELIHSFRGKPLITDENGDNIYSRIRYHKLLTKMKLSDLTTICENLGLTIPRHKTREILSNLIVEN